MKLKSKLKTAGVLVTLLLTSMSFSSAAETWPTKPIRFIVPGAPGGSSDMAGRLIADYLSRDLGQTLIVENKPSASSIVALRALKDAKPDGYTLGLFPGSAFVVAPWINEKLPYDVMTDFTPIGVAVYTPLAIAVKADSPYKTTADLIDAAKAKPDTVIVANPGINTLADLATKLISLRSEAVFRSIPYKGFPNAYPALIAGDVAAIIDGVSPMIPLDKAGNIRILSITSGATWPGLESHPLLNQVVANTTIDGWFGIFSPAHLSPEVNTKIGESVRRVMQNEELQARLGALGMYYRKDTPESFKKYIDLEYETWGDVIKKSSAKM